MRSLKESLLNSQENYLFERNAGVVEASVEEYINDNYDVDGKLTFYPSIKNNQVSYVVNCDGDVKVTNGTMPKLTEGFVWGEVEGDFDCSAAGITSLEGAPEKVGGNFDCHSIYGLKTLEGAPKEVGGHFDCSNCPWFISLEGAPEIVEGNFDCHNSPRLTSLKGAPKEVGDRFDCSNCKSLKSLEGAPERVKGSFYCNNCKSLKSLKGAPKEVGDVFGCKFCEKLQSLEGAPKKVGTLECDARLK